VDTPPKTERDLTTGSITRHIFTFGLPLVLAMVFHALFNLVDIYIVGKITSPDNAAMGSQAMAAVHIGSLINLSVMILVNGISVSSIAIISRYYGERRYEDANEISRQSLLLMLVLSVISALIGFLLTGPLVRILLGESAGELYDMSYVYLLIMMVGSFTMFFLLQVTAVLRAAGQSMWPMILLIGANFLNIVLDIFLIFGVWIFPEWGVAGAAWATVIARGIGAALGLFLLFQGRQRIQLTLRKIHLNLGTWWRLLKIGMPSTAQLTVRLLPMGFITRMIMDAEHSMIAKGTIASTGILSGAFAVGIRLDMLALFSAAGWGAAASSLVGQNLGARRPDRAAASGWITTAYSVGMMMVVATLFVLLAPQIVSIFDPKPDVIRFGAEYIRLMSFAYVFVSVGIVLASSLNGAGSTKVPLLIDFVGYGLLQCSLVLLLTNRTLLGFSFDHRGIYWAMIVTHVVVAAIYVVWFRLGRWKKIKIA
jgi:putative MATE family efflux protein